MSAVNTTANVRGKHLYITGGGGGLGLALARQLVPLGASVTLVTKDLVKIEPVLADLRVSRVDDSQKVVAVTADLSDYDESIHAFNQGVRLQGGELPSWVLLCAGFAKPAQFAETEPASLSKGFSSIYLTHVNTVHVATNAWLRANQKGEALLVSSIISAQSYAGYSSIAPARYALKGLSDTLESELLPQGIRVRLHMVSGQFGGGFDQEQQFKGTLTRHLDACHGYVKLDENVEAAQIIEGMILQ